ncbi:MAG: FGGY-family carbohydrate kinase, partial [Dehalococcoidia bacterium]
ERRTWTGLHLLDGRWVLEANPSDTGETVDAVRRLLRLSQARFDVLAAEQNDAAENIMAFWGPRALNLASPTMSVGGLLTPSPVTHQGLSAGAVARATLENAAFAMRECSELLESVLAKNAEMSGARDQAISLSGGMSQSRVFPQMLASVLGTPVLLHTPLATAAGAAIAVSRATGEWMQTAHDARGKALLIEPDPHDALRHDERYRRWLSLREWLDSLADEL